MLNIRGSLHVEKQSIAHFTPGRIDLCNKSILGAGRMRPASGKFEGGLISHLEKWLAIFLWYVIMIVSGKYFCSPKYFPLAIRADANFQFALVSCPPAGWHVGSLFSPHTPEAGRAALHHAASASRKRLLTLTRKTLYLSCKINRLILSAHRRC